MDWQVFRVVKAGMGTLHEVKYNWTIDELLEASDFLSAESEIEAIYRDAAMPKGGKK